MMLPLVSWFFLPKNMKTPCDYIITFILTYLHMLILPFSADQACHLNKATVLLFGLSVKKEETGNATSIL